MLTSAKRNMDVGPGNYAPSMVLVGWPPTCPVERAAEVSTARH